MQVLSKHSRDCRAPINSEKSERHNEHQQQPSSCLPKRYVYQPYQAKAEKCDPNAEGQRTPILKKKLNHPRRGTLDGIHEWIASIEDEKTQGNQSIAERLEARAEPIHKIRGVWPSVEKIGAEPELCKMLAIHALPQQHTNCDSGEN